MEWKVENALSRDIERQHLNKILKEIRAAIAAVQVDTSTPGANIKDQVGEMVENNLESGLTVDYDAVAQVLNFAVSNFVINLAGDVTGRGEVNALSSVTIQTEVDPSIRGIEEAPINGTMYGRVSASWRPIPGLGLAALEGTGFIQQTDTTSAFHEYAVREFEAADGELVVDNPDGVAGNVLYGLAEVVPGAAGTLTAIETDVFGRIAQQHPVVITGTAGEIEVVDGDAALGNPTLSLAEVTNTGIGASPVKIYTRDVYGRIEGDEDADTDDLPEGTTNLYFTDERAQDAVGSILADSVDIDFTYDDAAPSITGVLTPAVHASLDLADSAVQPSRTLTAGIGLDGGGDLSVDRTFDLDAASQASLALADTAVQSIIAGTNVTVDSTDPRNPVVSSTGGGATTFLGLTDTPASYTGAAGQAAVVNAAETGLEFVPLGGGGTVTSIDVIGGVGLDSSGGPIVGAGSITVDLDAASQASLALADSSIQPGDSATTLQMATNSLLGRTTAGTGAVEEITVGSNLTLSAGVLSASAPGTGTVTSVAISGTDGIEVDSGSPVTTSGTIQLGLSPAVLSQLADAATAVQPGDNVSVLVNDAGYTTNTGTVTSVAVADATGITWTGSPITASGTLTPTLSTNLQAWSGLATSAKEDAFSKGDLVQGSGVTLTGTLTNRLVGAGNITIAASGGGGGTVDTITAADSTVVVDSTDPANPTIRLGHIPTNAIVGRNDVGNGPIEALTPAEVLTMIAAQPLDADLTAIAGANPTANQSIYWTAANTVSTYSLTAGGRALAGVAGTANTVPYFSAANTVSLQAVSASGRNLWNIGGTAGGMAYLSGTNTWSLAMTSAYGLSLLQAAGLRAIVGDAPVHYALKGTGFGIDPAFGPLDTSDLTDVASGTYTPTLTGVANVASTTAYACRYMRVGNTVTVSGRVDVNNTLAGTLTQLRMSLPVASNFTTTSQCAGAGTATAAAAYAPAAVTSDAANNAALILWIPPAVASTLWLSFSYTIL